MDCEAGVKTEVQTNVIVQGHLGQEEIVYLTILFPKEIFSNVRFLLKPLSV